MILDLVAAWVVMPMLSAGLLLGFVRLALGPTLPDRVVAFDLITIQLVGLLAVLAIIKNRPVLIDVAAVWAIISFLSVIAVAFYIQKWRKRS